MRTWRAFALRVAGLFGFGRKDREIAEELHAHRDMLVTEYRRSGMDDAAARRAAAVAFGSVTAATGAYRDRRGLPVVEHWGRDCRLAFRSLRRSPGVFISMIAVLGLGVGFSTAVATVLHAIAWRALPVAAPQRIVRLAPSYAGTFSHQVIGGEAQFSYVDFTEFREATHTLDALAAMTHDRTTWRRDADARTLSGAFVSGEYFQALGVVPEIGRALSLSDAREPVAVISHRLWTEAFGSRPDAIGRTMSLDRSFYTVVGVAPESFTGTEVLPVDVWMPLEAAITQQGLGDRLADRHAIWLQAIGRLAPGMSIGAATSEAAVVFGRLDSREPGRRTTIQIARASRLDTIALLHSHEGPVVVGTGAMAAAMMTALLLICGSNAAALLLARGASRQKEIALRLALGAGRGRIAQQLLAEVVVIAAITAFIGAVVSAAALRALAIWLPPIDALAPATLAPEPRLLLFSSVFAAVVAFFFGLAPLRQTLQVDCLSNLKGDASMWAGPVPAARLRRALVATQVAVSVILLVAAALLGRAVSRSLDVDPGYVTKNLFIVQPDASQRSAKASPAAGATSLRVRDQMRATPGIESVGAVEIAPYFGAGTSSARTNGMASSVSVHFNEADEHYFETLGIRPIRGRIFRTDDPGVAVVNARLARMFWGSEDAALGRALEIGVAGYGASTTSVRVVGVIPSIQTTTPGVPDEATYYVPLTGQRASSAFLVVRAREGTRVPQVATAVTHAVDADAVTTVTPLEERLVAMTMPARIGALVAGLIGVLALLVSAVGIHGIVAHAVTARIRDIGVHIALGAPRLGILRLVLGWTMRGVAIGLLAGVAVVTIAAVAFPAGLRAALFGLNPLDPTALSLAGVFLIGVTLVAALLPARRALGMAPLTALRHD